MPRVFHLIIININSFIRNIIVDVLNIYITSININRTKVLKIIDEIYLFRYRYLVSNE